MHAIVCKSTRIHAKTKALFQTRLRPYHSQVTTVPVPSILLRKWCERAAIIESVEKNRNNRPMKPFLSLHRRERIPCCLELTPLFFDRREPSHQYTGHHSACRCPMVLHTLTQSNRLSLRIDNRPQDPDRVLVLQNGGLFQCSQCELMNKLCRVLCDVGLEILSADVGQYPPDSE